MEEYNDQNMTKWSRSLLVISRALVRSNRRIMGSNPARCIGYTSIKNVWLLLDCVNVKCEWRNINLNVGACVQTFI